MKLIKLLVISNLMLLSTFFTASTLASDINLNPDQVVKSVMQKITDRLKGKQEYYKKNPKELNQEAQKLLKELKPNLDLARMSWSIVGSAWRGASKDDKRAFISEFKTLLINTYISSLLDYVNHKIVYKPYRKIPNKKHAVIRSFAISDKNNKLPITYKLYQSKKYGWRIYDVTVVGVSLVRSYKSSFKETLRKSALIGLTDTLKKKNAK